MAMIPETIVIACMLYNIVHVECMLYSIVHVECMLSQAQAAAMLYGAYHAICQAQAEAAEAEGEMRQAFIQCMPCYMSAEAEGEMRQVFIVLYALHAMSDVITR